MTVSLATLKQITVYQGDEADLQTYVDIAFGVITSLSQSSQQFADQPQALLDVIELYLSAHYYVLSEERGGLMSQTIGESKDRYNTPSADKTGFYSTRFGQQACVLDATGVLSNASNQFKVSLDIKVI